MWEVMDRAGVRFVNYFGIGQILRLLVVQARVELGIDRGRDLQLLGDAVDADDVARFARDMAPLLQWRGA